MAVINRTHCGFCVLVTAILCAGCSHRMSEAEARDELTRQDQQILTGKDDKAGDKEIQQKILSDLKDKK